MSHLVSDELRLMAAPMAGYRALCQQPSAPGARTLLRRPALVAVIIGGVITLTTTGTLAPGLFLSSVLTWAVAPLVQALLAAALIALVRRRRQLPLSSALDLFFAGHGPWSLWLLALALAVMLKLPLGLGALPGRFLVLTTAIVPIAWTAVLTFAFCRTALGLRARGALVWTAAYQLALWTLVYFYVGAVTYRLPPFAAGTS
jgi:hypothetical protein